MSETEPQFKGPAIAVVVPVHNGAAFLQQCLASLAAQTFGDFACFVVDDGSTDESAELAAAWESRDARFVVIHQRQSGVAAARAAGVRAGLNLNARWFAFCDADDCYHKQFLDALYHAAQTTRCQIACCRYDCFTEDIPPESPPPSQTTVFQPPAHLDALLHDHRVDFGLWNKLYAHELITAIARASVDTNGKIIVTDDMNKAIDAVNIIAPEHLEICVDDPFAVLNSVKNAGSIFLGKNVPEALGDYFAGPNHTLPTSGTARFSSPLGVDDFVKKSSFIYYTRDALGKVQSRIADFAEHEGLHAHAKSVTIRFENQ